MINKFLVKSNINIFLVFILLVYILNFGGDAKYLTLLGFTFVWIVKFSLKSKYNMKIDKLLILLLLPIFFYTLYTLILSIIKGDFQFYKNFIKQLIFMTSPIIGAYSLVELLQNKKCDMIQILFWSIVIIFILKNLNRVDNLFIKGSDLFEGTEAFIFGLFLIYYTLKKNKRLSILSLIFMYLGNKRIALFSSILLSIICNLSHLNRDRIKKLYFIVIYIVIIFISIQFINLIYTDNLFNIMWKYNINMMGRDHAYSLMRDYFEMGYSFFGNGMGFTEYILGLLNINKFGNLHSDILKIYIELGQIGYIVYFTIFLVIYLKLSKYRINASNIYISFIIFTILNMFTDNIAIYVYYLLPMYTMIFYEYKNNK